LWHDNTSFFLIAAPVSLPAPTRELFNSGPLRENVSIAIEMVGESLTAERLRVGKHRDYLRESIKGIRIAVRENERKRIRECRADALLSPQERIELVKADRWVAYARAERCTHASQFSAPLPAARSHALHAALWFARARARPRSCRNFFVIILPVSMKHRVSAVIT
jgi:hypothetical protein